MLATFEDCLPLWDLPPAWDHPGIAAFPTSQHFQVDNYTLLLSDSCPVIKKGNRSVVSAIKFRWFDGTKCISEFNDANSGISPVLMTVLGKSSSLPAQ